MLNTYGPTEATVVATAADCMPGKPVTIGKALPGYVTYVLDEQMRRSWSANPANSISAATASRAAISTGSK